MPYGIPLAGDLGGRGLRSLLFVLLSFDWFLRADFPTTVGSYMNIENRKTI